MRDPTWYYHHVAIEDERVCVGLTVTRGPHWSHASQDGDPPEALRVIVANTERVCEDGGLATNTEIHGDNKAADAQGEGDHGKERSLGEAEEEKALSISKASSTKNVSASASASSSSSSSTSTTSTLSPLPGHLPQGVIEGFYTLSGRKGGEPVAERGTARVR